MELEIILRDAMIGDPFLHNGFWCVKKDDALAGMTMVQQYLAMAGRKAIMNACVGRERYTVNDLLEQFDQAVDAINPSEGPSKSKLPASPDAGGGPIHST